MKSQGVGSDFASPCSYKLLGSKPLWLAYHQDVLSSFSLVKKKLEQKS